jgi:hypothetical protein
VLSGVSRCYGAGGWQRGRVSAGLIAVCARTSWACYLLTCAVGWYPLNIRAPCDTMGARAMPTLRALRAAITAARRNIAYLGSCDRRQGGMKPRVALTNHFRKLIVSGRFNWNFRDGSDHGFLTAIPWPWCREV